MTTTPDTIPDRAELPPLPECDSYCTHKHLHDYEVFTADQMREYALAARSLAGTPQAEPFGWFIALGSPDNPKIDQAVYLGGGSKEIMEKARTAEDGDGEPFPLYTHPAPQAEPLKAAPDAVSEREAFEKWMTEDGKWPEAVMRNDDQYRLAQAASAWTAWQAAWEARATHSAAPEEVGQDRIEDGVAAALNDYEAGKIGLLGVHERIVALSTTQQAAKSAAASVNTTYADTEVRDDTGKLLAVVCAGPHQAGMVSALAAHSAAPAAVGLTDEHLIDLAEDFKSQYMHGGTTFDEFDYVGYGKAIRERALAAAATEIGRLRAEQSAAVMPMIGPLLDAWDGIDNDTKASISEDATDMVWHLKAINRAMEDGPSLAAPMPAGAAVGPTREQIRALAIQLEGLDVDELEDQLRAVFSIQNARMQATGGASTPTGEQS